MKNLLLHLNTDDCNALDQAKNTLILFHQALGSEKGQAILVLDGEAVRLAEPDSPCRSMLNEIFRQPRSHVEVCGMSLAQQELNPASLLPGCRVVKSGALALVTHRAHDFAYVKA